MRAGHVSLRTHKHITKPFLLKLLMQVLEKKIQICMSHKNAFHSDSGINLLSETELCIMDPVLMKGTDSRNWATEEKNLTAKY